MSTKKTIQINPELFKISGNKTKKAREKKEISINPVISPNNLKNKLLKRIKEHKIKETHQNENTIKDTIYSTNDKQKTNINYTDEFNNAMNYLSEVSKQKKNIAEKERYRNQMLNKTLKNPYISSLNNQYQNKNQTIENISLELPPELEEPFSSNIYASKEPLKMNYKYNNSNNVNDVPYGCLKNGLKPSYRTWIQTRKNYEYPEINNINIRPPTPPKKNEKNEKNELENNVFLSGATTIDNNKEEIQQQITREERLEKIRNKLRLIDKQEIDKKKKEIEELNRIGKELGLNDDENELDELPDFEERKTETMPELTDLLEEREKKYEIQNPKNKVKKTIKRKFTLGKSDKLRKVAILVKDKKTRKNILNTQKELKKMHINDVRKYLRQHGIIKAGTTCPPDILRKTFEMAMLAGEVTNINKDVILHNFMNPDKI